MTPLDGALQMAGLGFPVFPLKSGSKGTKGGHLCKSWKASATADPARIRAFAARFPGCNWAMRCSDHLVLDVDVSDGKHGLLTLAELSAEHLLPATRTHASARGGQHVIMRLPAGVQVTNRDEPLGDGINVRGDGGYIVCPGSTFDRRPYTVLSDTAIAPAPDSLVELLRAPPVKAGSPLADEDCDHPSDVATSVDWLCSRDVVHQGARGSHVYQAAARLRDWGISREAALELIADHYGARMQPEADAEFCQHEVWSAYKNARNVAGCSSVAANFDDMSDIAADLSQVGGAGRGMRIVWPATNEEGAPIASALVNIKEHLKFTDTEIWFDEFARCMWVRSAFFRCDEKLSDLVINDLRMDARSRGLGCPKEMYTDTLLYVARQNRRHPVRDYLDGLTWDGTARVGSMLSSYCGAGNTPLSRAAGTLLMVAAVRRIRSPGAKFDFLPVLEGPQGCGKSSFVKILAGEWGRESLSLSATEKEIIEQTGGAWFAEAAELSGMTRAESSHLKAALTRCSDTARLSYERLPVTVPRQFVAIGTTNDRRYLTDTTGNRRYLPLTVGKVAFARLQRDRDQLFAEACQIEAAYGPLVLPDDVAATLAEAQRAREMVDPVREALEPIYGGVLSGWVPCKQVWGDLGHTDYKAAGRDSRRLSGVMEAMGYSQQRAPRSVHLERPWVWVKFPANSEEWPARVGVDALPTGGERRGHLTVFSGDGEAAAADAEFHALLG